MGKKDKKYRKKHKAAVSEEHNRDKEEEMIEEVDGDEEENVEDVVPKWYAEFTWSIQKPIMLSDDEIQSLKFEAQKVFHDEAKFYAQKEGSIHKGLDPQWLKTILAKGTSRDKMAAHIIKIQNSPIHNLKTLQSLLGLVKLSKKQGCVLVMENLCDLFLEDLLKPGMKLKEFEKQPLGNLSEITSGNALKRRLWLSAWYFEDQLKDIYLQFIEAIDVIAKDTVDANREKAVQAMSKLLCGHPEREKLLLEKLVNKIGDPSHKVVSKVSYCLTQLLKVHPNMKQVVMNEVEKILYRTNIGQRTQYYCLCCLSQFVFKNSDRDIARNAVSIYFGFFKASISQGEIDSRMMGALLMGVKRAYPFAKFDTASPQITEHLDTLYKIVHISRFNIALHTLCLLLEVSKQAEDRYYSALYKKLLDPEVSASTHHALLVNLLWKSLSKDENIQRVIAFLKRLLQLCFYWPVPLVCSILYLASKIITRRSQLFIVELKEQHVPSFLLNGVEDDDDEEERYIDVDKEEDNDSEDVKDVKPTIGWTYLPSVNKPSKEPNTYDPLCRNPVYAKADFSAYVELLPLVSHYHPTVSLFAKKILNNEPITYTGDPLSDFTLLRFLERFVFKNPKPMKNLDDSKGPDPTLAMRKYYAPIGSKALRVTSTSYLCQDEKDVPVDELFLYRYLKNKSWAGQFEPRPYDEDDDNESVRSDEFEEMIQGMMGKKKEKLNFMDDVGDNLKSQNKSAQSKVSDDEEEEEDESEDEDEDDMDDNDVLSDLGGDDDEDLEFSDMSEEEVNFDEFDSKKRKKVTPIGKPKKFRKGDNIESLFAPAEEFAEILEETGSSKQKVGMAHSVANTDNSAAKQINWELKRDREARGGWKSKKNQGGKKNFINKKKFGGKKKTFR